MRKIVVFCSLLLLVLIVAPQASTQDNSEKASTAAAQAEPEHYYHLDFVVEQLDGAGKVVNTRAYSMSVRTGQRQGRVSMRTGSRIPVATGSYTGDVAKALMNTQFQYVNVGVNLDVENVREVGRQLAFDLTASLSGETSSSDPNLHQPVLKDNRWQSPVLVPIGKRTVVFTSDSLDDKGSTRVVVTAAPIEQ